MVIEFKQWIAKKNNQIGDKSGRGVDIDIGGGSKVQVFASNASELSQVVIIDNVSVRPIDHKIKPDLNKWRSNEQLRREVVQKLVTFLQETSSKIIGSKDQKVLSKTKAALRVSALKNLVSHESSEQFLPDAAYSLVLTSTHPSLLAMSNQLIPHLLSGIALTIVSNVATSIHVAYLRDLLLTFGLPSAEIINQLIDFEATNAGQIASFVLLENGDIDSILDTALTSNIVYGIPCIKIFAQESVKTLVQQILQHKLENQYPKEELFFENELFPQTLSNVKVQLDPVNFETSASGIEVLYFRSAGEALKMVNHLLGPLCQKFVSIWSENTNLAMKIAQAVQSCKQVAINGIPSQSSNLSGWQFELIAASALSRLMADNAESLKSLVACSTNKCWSNASVATRVRTVHSALDILELKQGAIIKLALQRTTKEIDEDATTGNLLMAHYEPIGQIIIQLAPDNEDDDTTALLAFGLNAIIYGNSLIIGGKCSSAQLAIWKRIENLLSLKGYTGVVQTVDQQDGAGFKVNGTTTSQGALQLLTDNGRTLQALYLDQSQFQQNLYGRLLRRVRRSIVLTLAEYDMQKIVE